MHRSSGFRVDPRKSSTLCHLRFGCKSLLPHLEFRILDLGSRDYSQAVGQNVWGSGFRFRVWVWVHDMECKVQDTGFEV